MDWLHLIEYEFLMTFFWVIFVFIPLPILIYGDLDLFQIDKKQIIMFLVMFFIRIILLVLSFNIVDDDSRVFMVDFVLLVVFGVILGFCSKYTDNKLPKIFKKKNNIISNQKDYLKDNYNLGGAENNGANNDGEYSNRITLSNHSNEGVYLNREANSTAKEICTYCGEEVKSDFIYCPACGKPIVSKMIQDTDGFK